MSRRYYYFLILVLTALLGACKDLSLIFGPQEPFELTADSWPEANGLFYENPNTPLFKGADVAKTVLLDDDRILWFFGDTLIQEEGNVCGRFNDDIIKVHNSVAVQTGKDPLSADIDHQWRYVDGELTSFFEPDVEDGSWLWMATPIVLDDKLLVFLMRARGLEGAGDAEESSGCDGLNFEMVSWEAKIATIESGSPLSWDWKSVEKPADPYWKGILLGTSSIFLHGNYLYAYSTKQAFFGSDLYLARIDIDKAKKGDLKEISWFDAGSFKPQSDFSGEEIPASIATTVNTENSISTTKKNPFNFILLQSYFGFQSPFCYRKNNTPFDFGTLDDCVDFFVPPELTAYPDSLLLTYALSLHPHLRGERGKTVATYIVNSCDTEDLRTKCDLYYPKFILLDKKL